MKEFQERVQAEADELNVKIIALVDFMHGNIYYKLPAVEQGLLMIQIEHMRSYFKILTRRIELF